MKENSRNDKSYITENWRDYINKNALILLIFLTTFVGKIVANFLPAKYTFDNRRILGMANNDPHTRAWAGTYITAANFFKKINFFNFNQMSQWSIFLGLIMMLTVLFIALRLLDPDFCQILFFLACVGLLNIYVFNIGKDVIQYLLFFVIYLVITAPFKAIYLKLIIAAVVLAFESTFFRSYYILIAAFAVAMFVILYYFCRMKKLSTGMTLFGIGMSSYLVVCLMMVTAQILMPEEYSEVLSVRAAQTDSREGSDSAVTLIQDLIPGEGLPFFLINYLINAVRMLLPLELLVKGVGYFPFLVFQIALAIYLFQILKKIREVREEQYFLALSIFMGYMLASFIFEPDFGSWLRHESSTFPVMVLLVMSEKQRVSEWKSAEPLTESVPEDHPSRLRWFAKKEA